MLNDWLFSCQYTNLVNSIEENNEKNQLTFLIEKYVAIDEDFCNLKKFLMLYKPEIFSTIAYIYDDFELSLYFFELYIKSTKDILNECNIINYDHPNLRKSYGFLENLYSRMQMDDEIEALFYLKKDFTMINNLKFFEINNNWFDCISTYRDLISKNPENLTYHLSLLNYYNKFSQT